MQIKQFEDKALAHYSYAIENDGKIILIDPARNPLPYYEFAESCKARIVGVIETHPHADFISSHFQIHKETGATIFVSKNTGADYPHQGFDEGDSFDLGDAKFSALNTPGHSPDSVTVVLEENGNTHLFTGDTLFIGDVGRPDLREDAGNQKAKREELASQMWHTAQNKFNHLPDEAAVYPAHGAGSLCGKNMSKEPSSTLGRERMSNWALQKQSEEDFVAEILKGQPFVPSYFGFDVDTNKSGPANYEASTGAVPFLHKAEEVEDRITIIDVRPEDKFKANHIEGSINIMARTPGEKMETWLGAVVQPEEAFYLVIATAEDRHRILSRVAKIGYEKQIKAIITLADEKFATSDEMDYPDFAANPDAYTIVDIRNKNEVSEGKFFDQAIDIPLNELRTRSGEIPTDKPVMVHCAGGYRSATGSSIIAAKLKDTDVYDLSDKVKEHKEPVSA